MSDDDSGVETEATLKQFLTLARAAKGMTLRDVEEATNKEVSNAYLSQLEKGKINKPSPNILYSLSKVYGVSYETLMARAGYITSEPEEDGAARQAKTATFQIDNITKEEEKALSQFLEYLRYTQRKKS